MIISLFQWGQEMHSLGFPSSLKTTLFLPTLWPWKMPEFCFPFLVAKKEVGSGMTMANSLGWLLWTEGVTQMCWFSKQVLARDIGIKDDPSWVSLINGHVPRGFLCIFSQGVCFSQIMRSEPLVKESTHLTHHYVHCCLEFSPLPSEWLRSFLPRGYILRTLPFSIPTSFL